MAIGRRVAGIVAVGLLVALPAELRPQERETVSFQARAGVAVPVGDLGDLSGPGPTFGGGVAYRVAPRLAVRADGAVSLLARHRPGGGRAEGPDLGLFHLGGGVELLLSDPALSRYRFRVHLGAGATTLDADATDDPAPASGFRRTYFAATGGLGVGLDVASGVSFFLDGQWHLVFADEEETAALASFTDEGEGFGRASVLPLTLGVRVRIP